MRRWLRLPVDAALAVDAALLALRDRLTPGQRWTSALGGGLVVVMLLFGLPLRHVVVNGAAATPAPVGTGPAPTAPSAPTGPPAGPLAPLTPSVPGPPAAGSSAPLRVVALVRPGGAAPPGYDDATVAAAFLTEAAVPWRTVDSQGDPRAVCRQAVAAGTVVLAADSLDPRLAGCLRAAGRTVLAYDEAGTAPAHGRYAALLSTRRGDADTLVDVARWGLRSGALRGPVGVVADPARRDRLAAAVARLGRDGVDVRAVAWLGGTVGDLADVPTTVTRFTAAGVQTVLFAVPVAVQDRFVAGAAPAGFRYVVTDVADAVADETYPPTFDGALAYTTVRVPWYAREHGQTAQQRACASVWTGQATPPVLLPGQQVVVDVWCEEVAAVEQAAAVAAAGGGDVGTLLGRLPVLSPLTSDLRPLPGGGWGPSADAVLVWRAACGCWRQQTGFRDRDAR